MLFVCFIITGTATTWSKALLWVLARFVPTWTAVQPWVAFKEGQYHRWYTMCEEEKTRREEMEATGEDTDHGHSFNIGRLVTEHEVAAARLVLRAGEQYRRAEEERRLRGSNEMAMRGTLASEGATGGQVGEGEDERDVKPSLDRTGRRETTRGSNGTTGRARSQSASVSFAPSIMSTGRKVNFCQGLNRGKGKVFILETIS